MDKTEKFIRDELESNAHAKALDVDALILGTHASIRRRARARKVAYSTPVVVLLIILGVGLLPLQDFEVTIPGDELFMAGWEGSWTEIQTMELDEGEDWEFYDQTVDYLIDDNFHSYSNEDEILLDEDDFENLISYMKET